MDLELDLSDWTPINLKYVDEAFRNLITPGLKIDTWITTKIETMDYFAFGLQQQNTPTMNLPLFDLKKLRSGYAFANNNLEEVNINFTSDDDSPLLNLQGIFLYNSDVNDYSLIKKINTQDWTTTKINNLSLAFHGMTSLEELDLATLDVSNVTKMNYLFSIQTTSSIIPLIDMSNWTPQALNTDGIENIFMRK